MDPLAHSIWVQWPWALCPAVDRDHASDGLAAIEPGAAASASTGDRVIQLALRQRLQALARTTLLLVVCDYEGTLAKLTRHPADESPDGAALAALRTLSWAPRTKSAIVSGRSLGDLSGMVGASGPEVLVGSHGAEWPGSGVSLSFDQRFLLGTIAIMVASVSEGEPGLICEVRPAGVALHVHGAERGVAEAAVSAAIKLCAAMPGVSMRRGRTVVEFMVVEANRGDAVRRLRRTSGASGVIFIGDELTGGDVFSSLTAEDVGIRVGPGDTPGVPRVAGPSGVAAVLRELASFRRTAEQAAQSRSDLA